MNGNDPRLEDAVRAFREGFVDEIAYALGLSRRGVLRRAFGPLFGRPAGRLASIAARADAAAGSSGLGGGSRSVLDDLAAGVSSRGTATIPASGPLLVVSNHPGGLDSLAILASIPRTDVHVILSDSPLTRAFRMAGRRFIFAPPGSGGRTAALRGAIARLRAGAAVLVFPHGDVEPDPETDPSSALGLGEWSRSVEVMLRAAPGTRLLAAAASGALSPRFARSPLVRVRRSPERRQKLAEVLQFIAQALRPGALRLDIHLSFAEPVEGVDLLAGGGMPAVARLVGALLANHREALRRLQDGHGSFARPDLFPR